MGLAEMEAKVSKLLEKERPELEKNYDFRISVKASGLAVFHSLEPLIPGQGSVNIELFPGETIPSKGMKILEVACQMVLDEFKNCAYESDLFKKDYKLRRATVEHNELYGDYGPRSQYWLDRVELERNYAASCLDGFFDKWKDVLMSSGGSGTLTPEDLTTKVNLMKVLTDQTAILDSERTYRRS